MIRVSLRWFCYSRRSSRIYLSWPNGIIFHQPGFHWNSQGSPFLNATFWGVNRSVREVATLYFLDLFSQTSPVSSYGRSMCHRHVEVSSHTPWSKYLPFVEDLAFVTPLKTNKWLEKQTFMKMYVVYLLLNKWWIFHCRVSFFVLRGVLFSC